MFLKSIVFLMVVYSVIGEDCFKYNFEEGFQELFNDNVGAVCSVIQQPWVDGQYAGTNIPPSNEMSTRFISPSTTPSCASSFEFLMSSGGILEFNIYMADNTASDQLTVMVTEKVDNGPEYLVGNLVVSTSSENYEQGWSTQRLTIIGSEKFQGYISFFGIASENSVVLVDSFRYIPPGQEEDTCVVYDSLTTTISATEDITTTDTEENEVTETTVRVKTEATPKSESATVTEVPVTYPTTEPTPTTEGGISTTEAAITESPEVTYSTTEATQATEGPEVTITQNDQTTEAAVESCTTYNFETDYELHFFNDNYLCEGLLPWQLNSYTSMDIDSPNSQSTVFITPHESISCMNSFVFKMDPDGVVEAYVYMDPVQALDHIIILAHRVTGREYDTTAGFKMYHPGNEVFVVGWNVIRFKLQEFISFDGYLIFIGSADANSTVLVDSIRYIPPRTTVEDASCDLY